jgi:D-alanyl-D-alanine carboxypeptidase
VASFNGRTGAVLPASADYAADQISFDSSILPMSASDVQTAIGILSNRVGCKIANNFPITSGQSTHTAVYSGMNLSAASVPVHVNIANPAAFTSQTITVECGTGGYITVTGTAIASTTMDIIFVDRYYTS